MRESFLFLKYDLFVLLLFTVSMTTCNLHSSMCKAGLVLSQFCGNRRERRNKIKVYKKKTEKCVARVIFCCTCSILYVSYYVRNHWCLLFLVGGEGRNAFCTDKPGTCRVKILQDYFISHHFSQRVQRASPVSVICLIECVIYSVKHKFVKVKLYWKFRSFWTNYAFDEKYI